MQAEALGEHVQVRPMQTPRATAAQFRRIQSRRGPRKAICAVAASILTAAYYILRDDVDYRDLGAAHFDSSDREKVTARLVKRLPAPGLNVQIVAAV